MPVTSLDHVAVPTERPEEMLRFYRALGFVAPEPGEWRASGVPFFSVAFGDNKINVHAPEMWKNPSFTLRGPTALPGSGDFCFVWSGTLEDLRSVLSKAGSEIEAGPVELVGGRDLGRARGMSVYTRDPDQNLLEFIVYGAMDTD